MPCAHLLCAFATVLKPGGAKGLGELPMDGPASALLNGVQHALGLVPRQVPLTPEVLMDLVEGA